MCEQHRHLGIQQEREIRGLDSGRPAGRALEEGGEVTGSRGAFGRNLTKVIEASPKIETQASQRPSNSSSRPTPIPVASSSSAPQTFPGQTKGGESEQANFGKDSRTDIAMETISTPQGHQAQLKGGVSDDLMRMIRGAAAKAEDKRGRRNKRR